jgi:predicted RNA-binding Zn-ribbon protein involved in translation (DUF1610 family)
MARRLISLPWMIASDELLSAMSDVVCPECGSEEIMVTPLGRANDIGCDCWRCPHEWVQHIER